MTVYKVLACTFALMTAILMVTVSIQDNTISGQRTLIRSMETNKSCMVATGGNQ